jgi:hypothetical protein
MKLWMLTEIAGEPDGATALVWAGDPGEAWWTLREKTGKSARVCTEILPAGSPVIVALIGVSAGEAARQVSTAEAAEILRTTPARVEDWDRRPRS